MLVTDIKRVYNKGTKEEKSRTGFYIDLSLKEKLDEIPGFLKKDSDEIFIVSGHGKVRVGKTILATQAAFYLAWTMAGGKHITDKKGKLTKVISPTKPVRFNFRENVIFRADDLQRKASALYEKYGPNQIMLYEDIKTYSDVDYYRLRARFNEGLRDFSYHCGFMNHILIIVLPDFFALHQEYATTRSLFLIDVFDKDYKRGYFNFYDNEKKDKLFFLARKKKRTATKYAASPPSFLGRFTAWSYFDLPEYYGARNSEKERRTSMPEVKEFDNIQNALQKLRNLGGL